LKWKRRSRLAARKLNAAFQTFLDCQYAFIAYWHVFDIGKARDSKTQHSKGVLRAVSRHLELNSKWNSGESYAISLDSVIYYFHKCRGYNNIGIGGY
jgi:hypothetical protein